jgi:hypothetical protein
VKGCKYARNGNGFRDGDYTGKKGLGGFPRKENLKRHLRRHGISGEKEGGES